jgi:hypothetical protein
MATATVSSKTFTVCLPCWEHPHSAGRVSGAVRNERMVWIAMTMFIALIGWGARYFGWDDPTGKVQLALFTSFILGAVCGYKSKD